MIGIDQQNRKTMPFKSVAVALLFSVFLGPVGLLYATTLGGVSMLTLAVFIIPTKLPVPIALVWIGSCVWSVIAANRFNKKMLEKY